MAGHRDPLSVGIAVYSYGRSPRSPFRRHRRRHLQRDATRRMAATCFCYSVSAESISVLKNISVCNKIGGDGPAVVRPSQPAGLHRQWFHTGHNYIGHLSIHMSISTHVSMPMSDTCLCTCLYLHTCLYTCLYVHTCLCTCLYLRTCLWTCLYLHRCLCTCLHTCPMSMHMSIHMSAHMSTHMSKHMPPHMSEHMSTRMSAHMSTHMYVPGSRGHAWSAL